MDTEIDRRAFARFDHFLVDLFFDLAHDFFDASRVNASVGDQIV